MTSNLFLSSNRANLVDAHDQYISINQSNLDGRGYNMLIVGEGGVVVGVDGNLDAIFNELSEEIN